MDLIRERLPAVSDFDAAAIDSVYGNMVRKLCNTRIQKFLSTQKQTFAMQKGCASTAGQNLRGALLSQHTNLHSHAKN